MSRTVLPRGKLSASLLRELLAGADPLPCERVSPRPFAAYPTALLAF